MFGHHAAGVRQATPVLQASMGELLPLGLGGGIDLLYEVLLLLHRDEVRDVEGGGWSLWVGGMDSGAQYITVCVEGHTHTHIYRQTLQAGVNPVIRIPISKSILTEHGMKLKKTYLFYIVLLKTHLDFC